MHRESFQQRWGRRVITLPGYGLLWLVATALLPALLVITVAVDLLGRRDFLFTRTALFLELYLTAELVGVLVGAVLFAARLLPGFDDAAFLRASFRVQQVWAGVLFGGGRRLFRIGLDVEGEDVLRSAIAAGPILVFPRHCSTADTVLPVALVSGPHDVVLRYVMKSELLWDPCLDIYGQRLPNAFVRRDSARSGEQIDLVSELSMDLRTGEGMLIYPEGRRYSPKAYEAARMAASGDEERVQFIERLQHVLPPKRGGPLAVMRNNPGGTVVFCGHTGLDTVRTFNEFVNGVLLDTTIRVKFWAESVASLPPDDEGRVAWLDRQWMRMDEFCAAGTGGARLPAGIGS